MGSRTFRTEAVNHPLRALTTADVNALRNHPRYVNEWDLPAGYVAARFSRLSYSGLLADNPHRAANILGTTRTIYYWIFVEEPGANGRVIGVPVIQNMANNGGIDTGRWINVRSVLGGTASARFSNVTVPNSTATVTRTVLRGILETVFKDVLDSVPGFRMTNSGSVAARHPDDGRSRHANHPNGIAIDINYWPNRNIDHERNERRLRNGINLSEPYLISAEVERILNRHGWQAGYGYNAIEGFFHWSVNSR